MTASCPDKLTSRPKILKVLVLKRAFVSGSYQKKTHLNLFNHEMDETV